MSLIGKAAIRDMLPRLDADRLSADVYKDAGIFILRQAIPADTIAIWQDEWKQFSQSTLATRNANRFNPVHVNENCQAD
jgi:hypothetical protein